jgi:hypothetical protein
MARGRDGEMRCDVMRRMRRTSFLFLLFSFPLPLFEFFSLWITSSIPFPPSPLSPPSPFTSFSPPATTPEREPLLPGTFALLSYFS